MRAESTAGFILGHTARSTDRGTTVGIMEFETPRTGRALVVIVDDRVAHGDNPDSAGPLVTELLAEAGFAVDGVVTVSADEVEIRNALNTAVIGGVDLVISVGGTGVSPRDVTPDATSDVLDRGTPGDRRGVALLGFLRRRDGCRPVPRSGRAVGVHAGRQPGVVARRDPRRHGHTVAARLARDRGTVASGGIAITGTDESAAGASPDDAPQRGDAGRARIDRARLRRVFGDVLPETTRDERSPGDESSDSDEWLRRQVPPHHGSV